MSEEWLEKLTDTPENMADYQHERMKLQVTERLIQIMEDQNLNYEEIAKRIGKSKRFVERFMAGKNTSLKNIARIGVALGVSFVFKDVFLSLDIIDKNKLP